MGMLDLAGCVKASRRFYRDHELPDWARAIPKNAAVPPSHDSALGHAEKAGFRVAFAFPPFALQMEALAQLIEATARRPASQLPDCEQYSGDVFLANEWTKTANGRVLQRTDDLGPRTEGAYLYVFSPMPYATAWGRTGRQIQELFHARGWQGLTVPEYFVLQRWFSERFGDHRFFEKAQDDRPGHAIWLIDSMTAVDCTVVVGGARGINVQSCNANNRERRRATVVGLVLPLRGGSER
jgi:hypothetical protein